MAQGVASGLANHCRPLHVAPPPRNNGAATAPEQRWEQITRLLHDQNIDLTDRVAGCMLLLYGQHLSRIAAMSTDQITERDGTVVIRLGRDEIELPDKLGQAALELARTRRPHTGVGSPSSRWLFPGGLPGKPISASHLGHRLRKLGIGALPGRRSTMTHLAAHLPAAVLADLLNLYLHRRALDARGRRGLDSLRRRTGPGRQSPTMTNASRDGAVYDSIRQGQNNALYQLAAPRLRHRARVRGPHRQERRRHNIDIRTR